MSQLDDIIGRLQGEPKRKEELNAIAKEKTSGMVWFPNPGPQTDAYFCEADELFYGGEAGGGKGFRKEEQVLTPTGWRPIGSLKRGSLICAPDGTATKIIGYFERGVQPLYRIRFHDGSEIVCDADHIWLAWEARGSRKIANELISGQASAKKWNTQDIADHYSKGGARLAIPALSAPACFNVAGGLVGKGNFVGRVVQPYTLGVLLGDGCITNRTGGASFLSADPQIANEVSDELNSHLSQYRDKNRPLNVTYRIPSAIIAPGLEALKLWGSRAETKSIPRIYLFAPAVDRWSLLQGLMDTDGWAEQDGDCYYCTISPQLADDVTDLARSLGAIVTRREKIPTYTHNGEKRTGQLAYTLRIKIDGAARMFRLERKKALCAEREQQSMGRFIESIEPAGHGETVCIAVEHPSSLFIVHDFIVTHNTDLLLGTALNNHRRGLILRRLNGEVDGLMDRMQELVGIKGLKRNPPASYRTMHKIINFGGCQHLNDREKYQGRPNDFNGFDEITNFLKEQYTFIIAWNRSTFPGQRIRTICTGNPPTTPEGMWVIDYWGPWLDKNHPNPALPGELRWFTTVNGKDTEVDGSGPVMIDGKLLLDEKGKEILPKSRTFIPAELADNPDLDETGYGARLAALPEELRVSLKEGDFHRDMMDTPNQVFPTAWVEAAMGRWNAQGANSPMNALAGDIAQGGKDSTVLCPRHGNFYDMLKVYPGKDTPDGPIVAGLIISTMRDGCEIIIDMGGGYGISTRDQLVQAGVKVTPYNGTTSADARRDRSGTLKFKNIRAAAHWHLRELLDPVHGSSIALPPDPMLKQEMVSIHYMTGIGGVQIEEKDNLKTRIGRSPDRMDAVILAAFARGATNQTRSGNGGRQTTATTSGRNPRRR